MVQFSSVDAGWEMTTPDLQALIELLPCPFCGSPNVGLRGRCIECDNCKASSGEVSRHGNLYELYRQWNTRHTAHTLPGAGGGDARDAARYRWLRERMCVEDMPKDHPSWSTPSEHESAKIDAAIDAALPPQQGG